MSNQPQVTRQKLATAKNVAMTASCTFHSSFMVGCLFPVGRASAPFSIQRGIMGKTALPLDDRLRIGSRVELVDRSGYDWL
jgi:hypothetical protein